MKKIMELTMLVVVICMLSISGCGNKTRNAAIESAPALSPEARGEYLVTIMGCHDCHSPKQTGPQGQVMIPDRLLSGYPAARAVQKADIDEVKSGWILFNEDLTLAVGPWGVSFSGNLTSDQTGIGNWTEENFKRALKEGKYKGLPGSRMLLPPMPWQNFLSISDDDVKAIYAFLKSTKPVSNVVPFPLTLEEAGK